jgi:serine/threonine protein kinase
MFSLSLQLVHILFDVHSTHPLDIPLEVIGSGTFGLIRKVKRITDGKIFARKELQFDRMTDRDRKQIVAEVNILRGLQHENIVKYEERFIDRENQ